MNLIAQLPPLALRLADAIIAAGGRPVLVGGAVRDHLLGLSAKDIDIEAYGLHFAELEAALRLVTKVHAVGKSFGVLKAGLGDMEIDVSLPRREIKVGLGHRGFEVGYDPFMSFTEAASRRDFTINAIGVDLGTGQLLDPWGGVADLEAGLIRHISDAFDEDPLRVLRACQFAARFGFAIAPETLEKCRSLQGELATLSTERIWQEFRKMLLKSAKPSMGFNALDATGALVLFPELAQLRCAPHNQIFHPEGDAWTHNNLVLDCCVRVCRDEELGEKEALTLMLAALCHDLGKPATANLIEGVWRNPGHEQAGEAPTRSLLARIGSPPSWADPIVALVREHTQPYRLWVQSRVLPVPDGLIRRLSLRVNIHQLCRLVLADFRGRASVDASGPCLAEEWLLERAARLDVADKPPQPILQGRDIRALGFQPGPAIGAFLKTAFEAQLDGEFSDLPGATAWARAQIEAGKFNTKEPTT